MYGAGEKLSTWQVAVAVTVVVASLLPVLLSAESVATLTEGVITCGEAQGLIMDAKRVTYTSLLEPGGKSPKVQVNCADITQFAKGCAVYDTYVRLEGTGKFSRAFTAFACPVFVTRNVSTVLFPRTTLEGDADAVTARSGLGIGHVAVTVTDE